MERTANMTYEEYAQFLVNNLSNPTKGIILDAIQQAGGSDDDAEKALMAVNDLIDEVQVDDVEDPSIVLEEGRDPDQLPGDEGMTLDELIEEGDSVFEPDDIDTVEPTTLKSLDEEEIEGDLLPSGEPGEPLDEVELQQEELNPDEVQMTGEELLAAVSEMVTEDPTTTNEDVARRLQEWGVPGDRIREFMDGLAMLKTTHAIQSKVYQANVSWTQAAQTVLKENPDTDTEKLRQALFNAGASKREVDEVMRDLPPIEMEDPMMAEEGQSQGGDWYGIAEQYLAQDPEITPEELMEILQGEGASPEEANEVVSAVMGGEEESFEPAPNDVVRTPRGAARVAQVHESFSGTVYQVVESDDTVSYYGINALSKYVPSKTSSNNIWAKIAGHMGEEWYTEMTKLPVALKSGYEQRVAATQKLRAEIKEAMKSASPAEEVELAKADAALENEECYCQDKLKNSFTEEEVEYLVDLPVFSTEAAHTSSYWGPDNGVVHMAALEAEEALKQIDWKYEVTAGADLFVEDVASNLIGDAGEVRRMAARHMTAKTASLPKEDAQPLVSQFIANVEKARKQAAIEARKNGVSKEASVDLPENFEGVLFY